MEMSSSASPIPDPALRARIRVSSLNRSSRLRQGFNMLAAPGVPCRSRSGWQKHMAGNSGLRANPARALHSTCRCLNGQKRWRRCSIRRWRPAMLNEYSYLYVEDDNLSREVMHMIMSNALGISNLTIFEDSTDFMARLKRLAKKPNVVLLDIHMKPLDGFQLIELLRADPDYQSTRIIALTASVMNEEVQKLRQSGFDGAIAKPLSIQTFPALMTRIIRGEAVWHIA